MAPQAWSSNKSKKKTGAQTKTDKNKTTKATVACSVKVIVRKRPVSGDEKDMVDVVAPAVVVHEEKVKVDLTRYMANQAFTLDDSFGEKDGTKTVYIRAVRDLVLNIFDGGTSTAFCFGQTASGKTFTLFGAGGGQISQETSGLDDAEQGGLYLLAAYEMYKLANATQQCTRERITVAISMYEIKGQKMYDLLNDRKELTALEDGNGVLQLVGLSQHACETLKEFLEATDVGRSARSTAATGANATSSRSHCAMLVRVYVGEKLLGKLSLIDLAGSERGADNENTDVTTRKEGRDINTSLLALKEVIRALQNGNHAPFRQSKLTQVLEESLTGKQCSTVVIACVSGANCDIQHTINTLRYAQDLCPSGKKVKGVPIAARTLTRQATMPVTAGRHTATVLPNRTKSKSPTRHGSVPAVPSKQLELIPAVESPMRQPALVKRSLSMPMKDAEEFTATRPVANNTKKSAKNTSVGGKNHTGVGMKVRVLIRKRPVAKGITDVIHVDAPTATVIEKKTKVDLTKYDDATAFAYDDAFCEYDDTKVVYDRSIKDLVANMFEGGTSMAFCFGQTASGKTFTLFGAGGGQAAAQGSSQAAVGQQGGLYLLSAHDIYQRVNDIVKIDPQVVVALSMYEIKGQKMYDLLNDRKELTALEDGNGVLQLVGLSQHACINIDEFLDATNVGRTSRSTAATGANATSSRSHCAMLIRVYKDEKLLGKLSLIDLAGSERGADNENTDAATRKEGRDINTSLLVLKEVIRALQNGNKAPFRQSRLTQVLEESLTGHQCRTVVIGCVSGAEQDTQHSINTLRYAQELGHSKVSAAKLKKLALAVLEKKKREAKAGHHSGLHFHTPHFHAPHVHLKAPHLPTSMLRRLSMMTKAVHVPHHRAHTPKRAKQRDTDDEEATSGDLFATEAVKPTPVKPPRGSRGRLTPTFSSMASKKIARHSFFKKQQAAQQALDKKEDESCEDERQESRNVLLQRTPSPVDSLGSMGDESWLFRRSTASVNISSCTDASNTSSVARSDALAALVDDRGGSVGRESSESSESVTTTESVSSHSSSSQSMLPILSNKNKLTYRSKSPDHAPPQPKKGPIVKVVRQPSSLQDKLDKSPRTVTSAKYTNSSNATASSKSSKSCATVTKKKDKKNQPNPSPISSRVVSGATSSSASSRGKQTPMKKKKTTVASVKDDWNINIDETDGESKSKNNKLIKFSSEDNVLISFNSKSVYTEDLDKEVKKSNLAVSESKRLTVLYEQMFGNKALEDDTPPYGLRRRSVSLSDIKPQTMSSKTSKVVTYSSPGTTTSKSRTESCTVSTSRKTIMQRNKAKRPLKAKVL